MLQVIMPGYCVAGTIGHKILSGQRKIELENRQTVKTAIFHDFLLIWISPCLQPSLVVTPVLRSCYIGQVVTVYKLAITVLNK